MLKGFSGARSGPGQTVTGVSHESNPLIVVAGVAVRGINWLSAVGRCADDLEGPLAKPRASLRGVALTLRVLHVGILPPGPHAHAADGESPKLPLGVALSSVDEPSKALWSASERHWYCVSRSGDRSAPHRRR